MQKISVKTPFNVAVFFNGDIVLRRIIAYLIDLAIIISYFFLVIFSIEYIKEHTADKFDEVVNIFKTLAMLPIMFYTLFLETIFNGQTIGKMLTGIKVIKIKGFQPNFVDYFVRWIFRAIEIYPVIIVMILLENEYVYLALILNGFIAFLFIVVHNKAQRIGDFVAGTMVVKSKEYENINITILEEVKEDYVPTFSQVVKLSDNDMRIIKETYKNATRQNNHDTLLLLKSKIETILGINVDMRINDFIDTVIKDYNYYTKNM